MTLLSNIRNYIRIIIYGIVLIPVFILSLYWYYITTMVVIGLLIIAHLYWGVPNSLVSFDEAVFNSLTERDSIKEKKMVLTESSKKSISAVAMNEGFDHLENDLYQVLRISKYASNDGAIYEDVMLDFNRNRDVEGEEVLLKYLRKYSGKTMKELKLIQKFEDTRTD